MTDSSSLPMSTAHQALHEVLTQLETLLDADGEQHWRDWMRRVRVKLEQGDPEAPQALLRAYGGMGSFNDLCIGQGYRNGQLQWKPGAGEANQRLEHLRGRAWELARALRAPAG